MRSRAAIATVVAVAFLSQTLIVSRARAEEIEAPAPPVALYQSPNVIEAASQLALLAPAESGNALLSATPKPIMSSNTKTVVIVAIIAGAVLILVGAIAIGKPFKKL